MIHIEKAQAQDLPFITVLWQNYLQACWTEEMIKESFDNQHVYTSIALSRNLEGSYDRIGFLMGSFLENAELYAIVVDKKNQGDGIGKKLLESFCAFLRKKNRDSLFLEVAADNLKALVFYENSGFQRIGVRPNYYRKKTEGKRESGTALVFEKKL